MTPNNYIKLYLQLLADNFTNIKLSYLFDRSYFQHTIVVTPESAYSTDDFAKKQIEFELDFIKKYPYESIYFVANGKVELDSQFELEVTSSIPKVFFTSGSIALSLPVIFPLDLFKIYINDVLVGGVVKEEDMIFSVNHFEKEKCSMEDSYPYATAC